jgi:DeoR/GlpR family transcriptional regulator of sugar metabolism
VNWLRAPPLVNAGETVFIENGSSNALLARTLAERGDITIITVSSYIAHLLKETPGRSSCWAGSTRSAVKVWWVR